MEPVCWLLFQALVIVLCSGKQLPVSATQQSASMFLLEPPVFPDLLHSFRQSLSASQGLRHLVTEVESIPGMPWACRGLSHINWTMFIEHHAGDWMSEALLNDCLTETIVSHPAVVVANWTLQSNHESVGMMDQGRALIVGISAGLTIALSVGAVLVLFSVCLISKLKANLPVLEEVSSFWSYCVSTRSAVDHTVAPQDDQSTTHRLPTGGATAGTKYHRNYYV